MKKICNKDGCSILEPLSSALRTELFEDIEGWWLAGREAFAAPRPPRLVKNYDFKDFEGALEFVNKIAEIAEEMNHHPNIQLEWGKVRIEIWTHAVDDLTEPDFILAKEIDYIT